MSAVKALQQWCKIQCEGYRDVTITNMTTSFRDGMAFCALIHRNRPDLINFDSLKKEDVYDNNHLAFRVAEDKLGIPALLDAEDMVALKIPDRLSILTYVSQYYNYFHGKSPIGGMAGIKRPAEPSKEEPSGKKNQAVVSKVYPSTTPLPSASPRAAQKEVLSESSNKMDTLRSKCCVCDKHVHLVQRHLVDGRLYHRNCAKCSECSSTLLSGNCKAGLQPNTWICNSHQPQGTPLRDLPKNTPATSKCTPHAPPTTKVAPISDTEPPRTSLAPQSAPTPTYRPHADLSKSNLPPKNTPTVTPTNTPSKLTSKSDLLPTSTTPYTTSLRPSSVMSSLSPAVPGPVAAPRKTTTAASKTQQARLRFFQSGNSNSPATDLEDQGKTQGQDQSVPTKSVPKPDAQGMAAGVKLAKDSESSPSKDVTKAQAAAVITKKLTEENNKKTTTTTTATASNNKTPPAASSSLWQTTPLKKTLTRPASVDMPKQEAEAPKNQAESAIKEVGGSRGRVKLKADPALLADPFPNTPTPTPARPGLWNKTPDKIPRPASPSTAKDNDSNSPSDWRARLKPVSKPVGPKDSSPLQPDRKKAEAPLGPLAVGAGKPSSGPTGFRSAPTSSPPPSSVSPPSPSPGILGTENGKSSATPINSKTDTNSPKPAKPDYIPKEEILKELQEIEDSVNDLERQGVELEKQLRTCEEEGEEADVVTDDLMVEWFNLIRNKQVYMRRESELVYIARTQDLEEQQPSVEQELRRLMEKPERLKTQWDRRREKELMDKLVEIVNDRNAIIDGLDEDRLREEEEDEEMNKMMKNLDLKKKKKKKSGFMFWGNKKD